jgi:DNA adenine methylase
MIPLIKWVGGKRKLLNTIKPHLPAKFGRYFEPFFGSGAMFLALEPKHAVINDSNPTLMNCYKAIRDYPEVVAGALIGFGSRPTEDDYARARTALNESIRTNDQSAYAAAMFLWINRVCFNGLWRLNRAGEFNVAFGHNTTIPKFPTAAEIHAASDLFRTNYLRCGDWEDAIADAESGDLVYLDPPYLGTFDGYSSDGFLPSQHVKMSNLVDEMADRGVYVIVSNSDMPATRELYMRHEIHEINRNGTMNVDTKARESVVELLIVAKPNRDVLHSKFDVGAL